MRHTRLVLLLPVLAIAVGCQAQSDAVATSQEAIAKAGPPSLVGAGKASDRARDFVVWAGRTTAADADVLRGKLAEGRNDAEAVGALAAHVSAAPDHSQALVALALLGEMRSPHALQHLKRIANAPLPKVKPRDDGEQPELDAAEMLATKAVDGLGYLGTPEADAEVLAIAGGHASRIVRAEAVDAYLYNHGDTAEARAAVAAVLKPGDQALIDRFRPVAGESPADEQARFSAWLARHPEAMPPAPERRKEVQ
jgi:hypothetical protein